MAVTADDLRAFERRVLEAFEAKRVMGPVHLSGGNEAHLIRVFRSVMPGDWVFSTYRSHYHALLHGIDPEWLFAEIVAGRSMNIASREKRFLSSAIVGGCLPIAVGTAAAIKRTHGMRLVTPAWRKETLRDRALSPITQSNGHANKRKNA